MKNRLLGLAALSSLLAALVLAVGPSWADSVDGKIRAIEQELTRLRGEQMELRKEATAAAEALPTFSYRPGAGVLMAAADRSWSARISYQIQAHMYNATDGNDKRGATTGDLFFRRNRLYFTFEHADGLLEWILTQDFDTEDIAGVQDSSVRLHLEKINPWLPTFMVSEANRLASPRGFERSATSDARVEDFALDILADSHVDILDYRGLTLGWLNVPVLTGDVSFIAAYKPQPGVNRNNEKDTDKTGFQLTASTRPFTRTKNPWIEKLGIGYGFQYDSNDSRNAANTGRLRLRTHERGTNRVTLLDANTIGNGNHTWHGGSLVWGYGPYDLAVGGAVSRYASGKLAGGVLPAQTDGFHGVEGSVWEIAHQAWLWSPKGLLTGSSSTANSVLLGWSFTRADANCGESNTGGCGPGGAGNTKADFHRNHLLVRELATWYFIRPAFRIGVWWDFYSAANVARADQTKIGCRKNNAQSAGKECDWHTVNVGIQTQF